MNRLTIRETVIFSFLGALMFISKQLMEFIPNVHMLGMFTMLYTVVYRKKALIPIYVFVFLEGVYAGFNFWWIPYLYIWTVLWGGTMLLPKHMKPKVAVPVYMIVCALHGLSYGTLYAPVQMIVYGMSLKTGLAWIATGFPWDCIHAVGNLVFGSAVFPLSILLKRLESGKYS